jgi:hypothetical protein
MTKKMVERPEVESVKMTSPKFSPVYTKLNMVSMEDEKDLDNAQHADTRECTAGSVDMDTNATKAPRTHPKPVP